MMPHQVSHRSDPTGGNGNLEQHGCRYELDARKSSVGVDCMAFKFPDICVNNSSENLS